MPKAAASRNPPMAPTRLHSQSQMSIAIEARFNIRISEQISRKATNDETTAPVPCKYPFFQLPMYFPISLLTGDINMEIRNTPNILICANTKSLCKISETKLHPLACLVLTCS